MRKLRLWTGIGISVVALILALRGIEPARLWAALAEADYRFLLPAAGALLAYLLARSVRWRILLGPEVSLGECFAVTNVGYLVSNVFPFRLGDPARAVIVGQGGRVSTGAALSTVIVERVLDLLMVVGLLALVGPFVAGSGATLSTGLMAGGAALLVLALLVVLAARPEWGRNMVRLVLRRLPYIDAQKWAGRLDGLFDGLFALRFGRHVAALLAWSVVTWALVVAFYYAMLRAFLPHPPLLAAPFVVCVVGLGMGVPSSPGAVGVFHALARLALVAPFSIPQDVAVSFAFVTHAFQYVALGGLGLAGAVQRSLSLGGLRRQLSSLEDK